MKSRYVWMNIAGMFLFGHYVRLGFWWELLICGVWLLILIDRGVFGSYEGK